MDHHGNNNRMQVVEEDELWNELNFEHSREIEQHHNKTNNIVGVTNHSNHHLNGHRTTSSTNDATTIHMIHNFIKQSSVEIQRIIYIFYDSANQAFYESQLLHRQQNNYYHYYNNTNSTNTNTNHNNNGAQNNYNNNQDNRTTIGKRYRNDNNRTYPNQNHFSDNVNDDFNLFGFNTNANNDRDNNVEHSYMDYTSFDDERQQQQHRLLNNSNNHNTTTTTTNNNNNSNNKNEFIFLDKLRYRPKHDGWASVGNLDIYFNTLYTYYYNRGLGPIVGRGIVEIVTLLFTLHISIFLFLYIDWTALRQCHDEQTCHANFKSYIIHKPISSTYHYTVWKFCIVMYSILFVAYTFVLIIKFIYTIYDSLFAKWVFEERLGINERKLRGGAVDWDTDVVVKLMELQLSGEYRIAINNSATTNNNSNNDNTNDTNETANSNNTNNSNNDTGAAATTTTQSTSNSKSNKNCSFDAFIIANRILRKENFLIALFNRGYLDLTVPIPFLNNNNTNQPIYFCSSIEWCIYFCILSFMFNHKYELRPAFYMEPDALRRRFQICGIVHLIFMPFLLFFMVLYFGLQNAYDWKSTKQYLGPRDWSMSAKWTFREFNELQHLFERRLAPSYEAAERYLDLFGSSEVVTAIGRILVFVGGSLGIVILVLAAINDALLLHVKIHDWNLLWYAGVVGGLYSAGKGMIPDAKAQPKASRNLYAEIDEALAQVSEYTHHYPPIWKGRGWEETIHATFSSMFQVKAKLFLKEVLSLILSPYILCVSLASCSEAICDFILSVRANIPGVGDVCGFATFDFDRYGDEPFEGRRIINGGTIDNNNTVDPLAATTTSLAESVLQTGNVEEAIRRYPTPKARYGKMEKSFFSFKSTHPSWKCSESGQRLVDRKIANDRAESDAINREQEVHIEAAARLLETLRQLEEGRAMARSTAGNGGDPMIGPAVVYDQYIPRSGGAAAADAGAGEVAGPPQSSD